jgi:predicted AlkP superfamily phosphohydrolase/phosphomutase
MTKKSNRVLIVGLDGATWNVLDPWIRDDTLPNLARLRRNGSWGELRSSIPPITAPAWSTFMTGKRPGKHGVFHFVKLFDNNTSAGGRPEIVNARSIKSPTLWDILGHHERKVALINVPMTYPPRPVNGLMITGLLTPRHASTFTYPPELSKEITDYVIDLDRFSDTKPFQGPRDHKVVNPTLSLIQEFRDMLEKRARTSLQLIESKPWDLFVAVFTGPDRMGHYLWPYHHPVAVNELESQELHDAVREYYFRMDELIGSLVDKADEDVSVIVMSDHGMGPIFTRRVHWNNWLLEHGWLFATVDSNSALNPDGWLTRLGLSRDKVGRILLRLPGAAGSRFVKKAVNSSTGIVDLNLSKAYCVTMYNTIFGIRINAEGDERRTLRNEIVRALEQVTDPETGQHVVQQVVLGEDYFHGPYAKNIPDIIVIMNPAYTGGFRISHYSSIATERQGRSSDSGDHRMEGIFMVSGPGIEARAEALSGLSIEDIAPTALYLMGLPVPSDIDGRVLTEILVPSALESRPVKQGEPTGFWPEEDDVLFCDEVVSGEDEEEIRKRLQALGYLE